VGWIFFPVTGVLGLVDRYFSDKSEAAPHAPPPPPVSDDEQTREHRFPPPRP
jgi:hypothetical protein